MQHLPTTDEQDWLIARLAELIARCGQAPFMDMPVLEPTPEFFPDPWRFSHRGLDRLVRRLMQYARLGELDVAIATYVELKSRNPAAAHHGGRSTAGLFMGIAEGRCLFGFNEMTPADAEFMAGVMCHEVAHAYRAHHELAAAGGGQEEELITDITTVYLGFGILSANNSFRFRTAGWNAGVRAFRSWSMLSTGYLPPQAFAFLLAVQMVARNLTPRESGRLIRHLEPDQAGFTKSALRSVWDRQADIMKVLGLSPGKREDAPKRLEEILLPLPEYAGTEAMTPSESLREPVRFNRGRPVFRVPKNRTHQYGPFGAILGIVVGSIGAAVFQHAAILFAGAVAGTALGAYRGHRTRFEVCSDAQCRVVLSSADTCPNCGGAIVGSIKHENDRLEAEDEWRRRRMGGSDERG